MPTKTKTWSLRTQVSGKEMFVLILKNFFRLPKWVTEFHFFYVLALPERKFVRKFSKRASLRGSGESFIR